MKFVTLMKTSFHCLRALALFVAGSVLAAEPAVTPAHETKEPNFRNHIESVLTNAGTAICWAPSRIA